ncbi:MAG: nucleoside monophosphate kinase, partial [Hadesarchaea archaeon]|nr:nucleoside monophosphate kinase [Hadesarchaea archaeon]
MPIITVSGLHGTGKSTAARKLAEEFDLRYVSAGEVFREMARERDMTLEEFSEFVEENPEVDEEIDQRTAREAEKDDVLIDGRLTGWMAEDADVR